MDVGKQSKTKLHALALASFMAIMLTSLLLVGCGGSSSSSSTKSGSGSASQSAGGEITFDTPFEFDGLTITFGSNVTAATVQNEFSEHSGATVAVVPITVTNNSGETKGLNMFYFKAFGPSGKQLDDVSTYFMDNDIAWAGEARSGASIESNMHLLYTEAGDYYVEFNNFKTKVEAKLPLSL